MTITFTADKCDILPNIGGPKYLQNNCLDKKYHIININITNIYKNRR